MKLISSAGCSRGIQIEFLIERQLLTVVKRISSHCLKRYLVESGKCILTLIPIDRGLSEDEPMRGMEQSVGIWGLLYIFSLMLLLGCQISMSFLLSFNTAGIFCTATATAACYRDWYVKCQRISCFSNTDTIGTINHMHNIVN